MTHFFCNDSLKFSQLPEETLPHFTRRFLAAADNAYPLLRSVDDEKTTVTAFLRALQPPSLARSLFSESTEKTLQQVIDTAMQRATEHEKFLYQRLRPGEELMDTSSTSRTLEQPAPTPSPSNRPFQPLEQQVEAFAAQISQLST